MMIGMANGSGNQNIITAIIQEGIKPKVGGQ